MLGVCLGHQAIAQAFGATIGRAKLVMHGKLSPIEHDGTGVFADLPTPFAATRYHSLVAIPETMPAELKANAWTADGTIMGLRHTSLPKFTACNSTRKASRPSTAIGCCAIFSRAARAGALT